MLRFKIVHYITDVNFKGNISFNPTKQPKKMSQKNIYSLYVY